MNLVGYEIGQSLQLIHMDEVRPLRGGAFLPEMVAEVVRRYRFQSVPTKVEPNQPAKFENGVRELGGTTIPIASLEVYIDGLLVNTSNTEDSDVILDDFVPWALDTFKFREPRTWLPRRYQSRIIVDFGKSAGQTFFKNFADLREIMARAFGSERDLAITQISFGPHPPGELPALYTWTFQPRIGQPYVPNRYFSAAPLSTPAHLKMLHELEIAAIGSQK
jgi:hypothetical protein